MKLLCDANVRSQGEGGGSTLHQVWHTCRPAPDRSWLDSPADVYTRPDPGQRLSWQTAGAEFHLAGCRPLQPTPSRAGTCQVPLWTPEG